MIESAEHFTEALSFIEEYQSLMDCHLVDFITENLWEKCLPDSLRLQLEETEVSETSKNNGRYNFQELTLVGSKLNEFVKRTNLLSLKNSRSVKTLDDLEIPLSDSQFTKAICSKSFMNFMSDKKKHEIEVLAKLIGHLAGEKDKSLVIDAGAGKGYLSTNIMQNYGIPVLAIDSSEINHKGAIHRQEMILKKKNEKTELVRYSVQHIDEKTNWTKIIQSHFSDWEIRNHCILTGLHTCGQLAHSIIRNFLTTDSLKCLCIVPCCYHLTEEFLTGKYNLSKNARMIAQQSVERTHSKHKDVHSPSLFYRALLQIILKSLGISNTRIGRGAPTENFPTYARWALTKIGVDPERIPSNEFLTRLFEVHSNSQWRFNTFQSMRIHLGSVIEAAIVLDRFIYIQNSGQCSNVLLIRLFDPLISPRCYTIVALK